MKKGKLIVIDGGEGSGKSTQIQFLKEKYPLALFTREPGGSEYGEEIRNLMLKSPLAKDASAETQFGLIWANRADHVEKKIRPALEKGINVISDRFDSCTFAYQIYGQEGTDLKDLFFEIRKTFLKGCVPDLYVFFDISPEESLKRTTVRANLFGESNHFDERKVEFHARVREGYAEFARLFPKNTKIINAHGSKEEVRKSLQKVLDPILG